MMGIAEETPRKLWNGVKTKVNLGISFYGKSKTIHIGKDVIRVMGGPSHICIKVNKNMDSIMLAPCKEKDPLAFKVPDTIYYDKNVAMRVSSQAFVEGLMIMNDLDLEKTYQVEGLYTERGNAVIFKMSDCELLEQCI